MKKLFLAVASMGLLMSVAVFLHHWHAGGSVPDVRTYAVDFDQSMRRADFEHVLGKHNNRPAYEFFKQVYDAHSPRYAVPSVEPKIPHVLHYIWLGGKLPREYEAYVHSWHEHHPGWHHIFWTDSPEHYARGARVADSFDEIAVLLSEKTPQRIVADARKLVYANKQFFDASRNYGERSDILKWEAVYRFGGVYVDTDFECYRPLDQFNATYHFYTGLQPLDTNYVQLGAALFAAMPGHPIMRACVEGIAKNQHIVPIVLKTGPLHFTQSFITHAPHTGLDDIALPASYFYPCSYEERGTHKERWCKQESWAVHHWAGSWLKKEGMVS